MSSLRSITDDMEYYHRAFGIYHRVANRNGVLGHWVDTELREIVEGMEVNVTGNEPMRALSIGPGDGEIESKILKILYDRRGPCDHVHSVVVEPVADMVSTYKERLAGEASRDITFEWKTQTLDEYQHTADNDGVKFHFISSVHSIYYVSDLQASLQDLYEQLEPGGVMLIVVVSDKSGMGQIWRSFPHLQTTRHHLPTSAEIRAACTSQNIAISQELTIKVRSNITACFSEPKDLTEDGQLLLDFFAHVVHFVRDAPDKLRQEVVEFLGSDSCSERGDRGEVIFIGDWKAFIIRRS